MDLQQLEVEQLAPQGPCSFAEAPLLLSLVPLHQYFPVVHHGDVVSQS